jgi:hypothetical protein
MTRPIRHWRRIAVTTFFRRWVRLTSGSKGSQYAFREVVRAAELVLSVALALSFGPCATECRRFPD